MFADSKIIPFIVAVLVLAAVAVAGHGLKLLLREAPRPRRWWNRFGFPASQMFVQAGAVMLALALAAVGSALGRGVAVYGLLGAAMLAANALFAWLFTVSAGSGRIQRMVSLLAFAGLPPLGGFGGWFVVFYALFGAVAVPAAGRMAFFALLLVAAALYLINIYALALRRPAPAGSGPRLVSALVWVSLVGIFLLAFAPAAVANVLLRYACPRELAPITATLGEFIRVSLIWAGFINLVLAVVVAAGIYRWKLWE